MHKHMAAGLIKPATILRANRLWFCKKEEIKVAFIPLLLLLSNWNNNDGEFVPPNHHAITS
jgi:hypothetical protein